MSAKSQAAAITRVGDTKEKRTERMRVVARARWDKSTLAERQRSVRVMNEARKKKYA